MLYRGNLVVIVGNVCITLFLNQLARMNHETFTQDWISKKPDNLCLKFFRKELKTSHKRSLTNLFLFSKTIILWRFETPKVFFSQPENSIVDNLFVAVCNRQSLFLPRKQQPSEEFISMCRISSPSILSS